MSKVIRGGGWLVPTLLIASLMGLSACGGGSSGGGSPTATIKGQVVDKLLPGAIVKLYSGNPYGTPITTTTADSSGNYSLTFTPSGSTPLFLTATTTSGNNTLGSYIGSSNSFSGTATVSNNPNLNITQVTTATIAVIQSQGVSLDSLTPASYGQQILNLENAIIQLAAVVQDVVDQTDSGCALNTGPLNYSNLSSLLGTSAITSATNVITSVSSKLSSCTTSTLNTLASQIPSNTTVAPQLTSTAALNSTASSVAAGTYSGPLTPIITFNTSSCTTGTPVSFTATFTVNNNGSLSFSSSGGGSGTGTLTGNNFTMNVTPASGGTLSATGAFVPLSSGTVSGGSGFSVNGGWTEQCNNGGSYGGTYNAPDLLSTGASLGSTPSNISNGTYSVTGFSYTNTPNNCSGTYALSGTITISGGTISFSGNGSNGHGSGTLAGNTFTMNVTPGSGSGTIYVTGVINSQSSSSISISGSFQESNNSYCNGSGTYSLST